jgi:hypothetical protein
LVLDIPQAIFEFLSLLDQDDTEVRRFVQSALCFGEMGFKGAFGL